MFFGFRYEVVEILQKFNHSSRAFLIETDGLKDILISECPVMIKIKEAHKSGEFLDVIRRQVVDFDEIL